MEATVSDIHEYPLRPEGYAEPLFHSPGSRREILEHLAQSSWLSRASGLKEVKEVKEAVPESARIAGRTAHVLQEPVEVRRQKGRPELALRRSARTITRVLESWREMRSWWREDGADLLCYRVELDGGAVVDLTRDRGSGTWTLSGIVD